MLPNFSFSRRGLDWRCVARAWLVRPWRGWAVIALFWGAAISGTAWAEVKQWRIGEGGLSWSEPERSSTAIDFSVPGAIQLVGFNSNDNIVQQLTWVEEFPADFIAERPDARIWDNIPLKQSNLPIVDGDDTTSTGERFKRFGVSQAGTVFYFDLGAQFPVNRMVFFPRQTGADSEGRSFADDFIRSYEIFLSDGLTFDQDDLPIYSLLKREEFTRESISEIRFPLRFIRYIRLKISAPNPFEIAEFQIFGGGFAPRAEYLSEVIDLGEAANYSRLEWTFEKLRQEGDSFVVAPDEDAEVSVRMRTGIDDDPQIYHKIVNQFNNELREVESEAAYYALLEGVRGPIKDDQVNWSLWSAPFTVSGEQIDLPSPRRYFQFAVALESHSILSGVRVKSLSVEHAIPPLAKQLVGEISLLDDPRPPGNVPVAPAGESATFAYDVRADVGGVDLGFDALRIFTPSEPDLKDFLVGDPPVSVSPDRVETGPDFLTVFFPSHRVVSRASGILRVIFEAQVFVQGTFFNAEVFDAQTEEFPQKVLSGDANPGVLTDALQVMTSAASTRNLLPFFAVTPRVISPNGDGRNDRAGIGYTLVQLVRPVEVEVEVFDLGGRKVRTVFSGEEGSGSYTKGWDGLDDNGKLLPVGIYAVKFSLRAERETLVRTGTVGVVY